MGFSVLYLNDILVTDSVSNDYKEKEQHSEGQPHVHITDKVNHSLDCTPKLRHGN